eukprot:760178-Hanusia_phi.AAC.2
MHFSFFPAVAKVAKEISKLAETVLKDKESRRVKWSKKTLSSIYKLSISDADCDISEELDALWDKKAGKDDGEKVQVRSKDAEKVRSQITKLLRFLKFVPVEFFDKLSRTLLPLLLCTIEVLGNCVAAEDKTIGADHDTVRLSRAVLRSYTLELLHKDVLRGTEDDFLTRHSRRWLVEEESEEEDGSTCDILLLHGHMVAKRFMSEEQGSDSETTRSVAADLMTWMVLDSSEDKRGDVNGVESSRSIRTFALLKGMIACWEGKESHYRATARMEKKNRQTPSCKPYRLSPSLNKLIIHMGGLCCKHDQKQTDCFDMLLGSAMIRLLNLYKSPHCITKDKDVDALLTSAALNDFLLTCLGKCASAILACQKQDRVFLTSCEFALSWCKCFHRLFAGHQRSFSTMLAIIITFDGSKIKDGEEKSVAVMGDSSAMTDIWNVRAFLSVIINCTRSELGLICRSLLSEFSRVMKSQEIVSCRHQLVNVITLSRSFLQSFSSESKRWGLVAPFLTRFMCMVSAQNGWRGCARAGVGDNADGDDDDGVDADGGGGAGGAGAGGGGKKDHCIREMFSRLHSSTLFLQVCHDPAHRHGVIAFAALLQCQRTQRGRPLSPLPPPLKLLSSSSDPLVSYDLLGMTSLQELLENARVFARLLESLAAEKKKFKKYAVHLLINYLDSDDQTTSS